LLEQSQALFEPAKFRTGKADYVVPKQFPRAYNLFCRERFEKVKNSTTMKVEFPFSFGAVSKTNALLWKSMSKEEKKVN
jgi:hypothetical protein